jgi:hypothetical protein
MKKHLILLALPLLTGMYASAQVSFGVKAGFSGANVSSRMEAPGIPERKADTKMLPAFHAGLIVDLQLAEGFSLQPGLFYSAKGVKNSQAGSDSAVNTAIFATAHLNYLELPVNFLYKHPLGSGKLFAGFGPYLAYGIGGKVKLENAVGSEVEVDLKFKNDGSVNTQEAYVKPFDAGANFIVGYELNMGLLFSVNYSLGLTNTSPYQFETEKNRYFGISVGYLFKQHK